MSNRSLNRLIIFGEVLYDRFPDGSVVLGGAPFNVACHLQAFGLSPLFISRVGDDALGRRVRDAMLERGMDTSALQQDSAHPTGTVDVSFPAGEPSFDIVAGRAYDFIEFDALPPLPEQGICYHGSLAVRNQTSRDTLRKIKQQTGGAWFVDVNLRAPWWSLDEISACLRDARWIKLNEDELRQILPGEGSTQQRAAHLLANLSAQLLVVTLGKAGAIALSADGGNFEVRPVAGARVVDSVGAGDAFSSVLLLGQSLGWRTGDTLSRAQDFASAIVGVRGATVEPGFYQPFLADWKLR